ncbi:MAG: TIGR00268 family protein [Omnitrophica WOR_2 bacterium RBG_13_41_10]|nr:MAG: TIGR00268 family protein [Omnitrophica WOR_2 bacterium RBG_13_41_10]
MNKLQKIKKILKKMGSVLIAYSGGVDSTLLLKLARDVLGGEVLAVTAVSPTYPQDELIFSKIMARNLGVKQRVIKTCELKNRQFIVNRSNRCYFCKKELFRRLKEIAKKKNIKFVIDATNLSDNNDFRPGSIAKKELGIRSPLAEAGFTKADIRKISKRLKLPTWNKPALACLASRIAYGEKISVPLLNKINQAEAFLKRQGFIQVRLRHYNGLCRLEMTPKDILLAVQKRGLITRKMKQLGYNYVTLDLEGYRTGSMNEVLKKA